MRKPLATVVLGLAAIYSVVAVARFMLHHDLATDLTQLPMTLVYCGLAVIPYALLGLAIYLASDRAAYLWVGRVSVLVIGLSLWTYSLSFAPNDEEYVIVYTRIPALQSLIVLIILGVFLWGHRRSSKPTPNDPRIKRLLKRYRKGDNFVNAIIDVSHIELDELLKACSCSNERGLVSPKELDDHALAFFSRVLADRFDHAQFDFFLHSYVRTECVGSYYSDPTVTSKLPPENGPPAGIHPPEGTRWVPMRPQEGQEHYEAFGIDELKGDEETPTIH